MDAIQNQTLRKIADRFDAFRDLAGFSTIHTEAEYDRAVALVDAIIEEMGEGDESHPLAALLEFITPVIEGYESEHCPMPDMPPREIVRYLMEQNSLTQRDLPEIGNQSAVSHFLSGKRDLTARQIAALAARFHLSADAFIEHRIAAVA